MAQLAKYVLPKLAYGLQELEPVISRQIVDIHYNKHHLTYVNNLNAAMEQLQEAIVRQDLPNIVNLQPTIIFNGGSHLNHSMYWENLAPIAGVGGKLPPSTSPLFAKVREDWGSFDQLIEYFTKRTTAIKGSGWGWLVLNKSIKKLEYVETHDQDTISMLPDLVPLLTIDVWEHAYYLDYKNARLDYMKNIWKIINWQIVEARFLAAAV